MLESHLFLKEKQDNSLKGCMVAGGNKQRGTMPKEEASSPTAALESALLTAVVDAAEGRDVAIVDIPNAFVQTKLDDVVHMRLRGRLAELMVELAPQMCRKHLTHNKKGEAVLCVRLRNALYGMLKAALLFYQKLVHHLESQGFELNPYDPCVANKMIDGKQFAIAWHVDDLKCSHMSPSAATSFLTGL